MKGQRSQYERKHFSCCAHIALYSNCMSTIIQLVSIFISPKGF